MNVDIFQALLEDLRSVTTANLPVFVAMGNRLFTAFATIVIAWFGIQTALDRDAGPNLTAFSRLLMLIAFGFAITRGYASPIPGIGMSFPDLIIEQADYMANEIGQGTAARVTGAIVDMADGMVGPTSVWNMHEVLTYVVIQALLFLAAAAIYMVLGFAIVAQGVLVMLGPVFVPFLIVPKLDFLFWSWFRSLLTYSFVPVIGNAFIFIFGNLLLRFFAVNTGGMTAMEWLAHFPATLVFLAIFLYGVLKIPRLTNDLFTGGSAAGDSGFAQAAFRAATMKG